MRLKDKVAIITGGSRGIGYATVEKFLKEGATVILTASSQGSADKAVAQLKEKYPDATVAGISPNLSNLESVRNAFREAASKYGCIDILVNNAGICKLNKVLDFGRADWDPMIDVNLTAAFELSYEAAKIMIPQKSGKIINICSLFSYLGGQWSPAYSATKHALAGFTKAYCDELGQYNIQVNGIAPGYYATDITLATRSNPETNQRVLDHIPANRWGDTQDLMGAAVFLASPASNYVNGHLLVVDGGYLVR